MTDSIQGARGTRIAEGDYVSLSNDATSRMLVAEISHVTGKVRTQNGMQSGVQGTWHHAARLVPYGQTRGEVPAAGRAVNPDRR